MYLLQAVKKLIGENVSIPIVSMSFGILFLKLTYSSAVIKILRWLLPILSFDFIENLLFFGGLTMLSGSFGMFVIWMNAYNKKRLAGRKTAMRQAAREMNWHYDEYQKSGLSPHLNNYKQCRILGIAPDSFCSHLNIANILSQKISGEQLIVFDSELTESSNHPDKGSFVYAETVYLIVSDKLNLPYFQTQPESWLGDNAVADFLKNKPDIDFNFSHRPDFSKKYLLSGSDRQSVERLFTPAFFYFYEQNQLYRTIGDGKMFCLIQLQTVFINQFQINAQLKTLHQIIQLIKNC